MKEITSRFNLNFEFLDFHLFFLSCLEVLEIRNHQFIDQFYEREKLGKATIMEKKTKDWGLRGVGKISHFSFLFLHPPIPQTIYCRAKDGMVEIHKDQGLAENPMDRIDETLMAKVFMKS